MRSRKNSTACCRGTACGSTTRPGVASPRRWARVSQPVESARKAATSVVSASRSGSMPGASASLVRVATNCASPPLARKVARLTGGAPGASPRRAVASASSAGRATARRARGSAPSSAVKRR